MDENKKELKGIRTLESDVMEGIRREQINKTDILIAEQQKQRDEDIRSQRPEYIIQEGGKKNIKLFVFSFILIVLGFSIAYFIYTKYNNKNNTPVVIKEEKQHLIQTESAIEVPISSSDRSILIDKLIASRNEEIGKTETRRLDLVVKDASGTKMIKASDFARFLEPAISGAFYRSLQDDFLVGVYKGTNSSSSLFAIFRTDSYEAAAGGMLALEENFVNFDEKFQDKVIENKDTRILKDIDGNTIMIYALINGGTLVIAESEEAFKVITQKVALSNRQITN